MIFRYIIEVTVGTLFLISTLLLGQIAVLVFLLFIPVFYFPRMRRQNMDERELQLHYKIGNFSTIFLFQSYVIIELLSDTLVYGHRIGDFRIQLCCSLFYLAHGITGTFIFAKN